MPRQGKYVGASSMPFSDYKQKRGDRLGLHWRVPTTAGRRHVRYVLIELTSPSGSSGRGKQGSDQDEDGSGRTTGLRSFPTNSAMPIVPPGKAILVARD